MTSSRFSDISRHRRAETALRDSQERLAPALLGYTMDQMTGRSTLDFIAPGHRQQVADVIKAGSEIGYDSRAVHVDGFRVPVEFMVRTLRRPGRDSKPERKRRARAWR